VMSMFFGAIPMGLATIVNGFLAFGIPLWGQSAVEIAHTLWWVDAAMALLCGMTNPFPDDDAPGSQHRKDDGGLAAAGRCGRSLGRQPAGCWRRIWPMPTPSAS